MSRRKDAIAHLRIAGYHQDSRAFARLYAENRISYHFALAAYWEGEKAKANGIKCDCIECKKTC